MGPLSAPPLLLILLLLLGPAAGQAQAPVGACEEACGAALRNQDAVRANLRVDDFAATSARQTEQLLAEFARASAETKAELARASAETKAELARAKEDTGRAIAALTSEFARLRASFDSWTEGPSGKLVIVAAAGLFSALLSFLISPRKYITAWAVLTSNPEPAAPAAALPEAAPQGLHRA